MRVIAGSARGARLKVPREGVRPTSDRVKEALFSILGARVLGATVWDLFAGSGAIGIEALSRGASECIFVEKSKPHLAIVKDNLRHTRLLKQARLMQLDVGRALHLLSRERLQADLIFLDAPYQETNVPHLLEIISSARLLSQDGLIVLELFARTRLWPMEQQQIRQRKYGDTILAFIEAPALPGALAALISSR